jgi:hypothetical protein
MTNRSYGTNIKLVRLAGQLASQPAVLFSDIKSAPVTSYLSANIIFLSQKNQHQPPASQTS